MLGLQADRDSSVPKKINCITFFVQAKRSELAGCQQPMRNLVLSSIQRWVLLLVRVKQLLQAGSFEITPIYNSRHVIFLCELKWSECRVKWAGKNLSSLPCVQCVTVIMHFRQVLRCLLTNLSRREGCWKNSRSGRGPKEAFTLDYWDQQSNMYLERYGCSVLYWKYRLLVSTLMQLSEEV